MVTPTYFMSFLPLEFADELTLPTFAHKAELCSTANFDQLMTGLGSQTRTSSLGAARPLPPSADIRSGRAVLSTSGDDPRRPVARCGMHNRAHRLGMSSSMAVAEYPIHFLTRQFQAATTLCFRHGWIPLWMMFTC